MKKYFLKNLGSDEIAKLCERPAIDFEKISNTVKPLLEDIKKRGDTAIKEYTKKFDGVDLDNFTVTDEEIRMAAANISDDVKASFYVSAENIRKFHSAACMKNCDEVETTAGVFCFAETRPIEKVGIYIPGGTAPLPSTVLMLAIPAKIAGCQEIIMCTPPNKEGKIPDIILFAAKLAGVTKIFKIGGAQAIAAMAYGTKTVPKVYKITGPGNQYVTAAKMLVSVDPKGAMMDLPAGPSEVLVIADENAEATFVAADLLSQAEHGVDSQVVLVCTSEKKFSEIEKELAKQLAILSRKNITAEALSKSFALIIDGETEDEKICEAIGFANIYAPEHLILNIENSRQYIPLVVNAGSVFLGQLSCESAGDYASGTNHTLPTYGYAKMYSGVSADTYIKKITFQELTKKGIKNLGPIVEKMARVEGLTAHENAMTVRLKSILKK